MTSSLYSAFILKADESPPDLVELFTYGRGQNLSRSNAIATQVHTNVPRASYAGLPIGWSAQIDHWRAQTGLRFLTDPALEWASTVSVELVYSARPIEQIPLVDLLLAAQPVLTSSFDGPAVYRGQFELPPPRAPLHMLENITYYVRLSFDHKATQLFQRWIVENIASAQFTCWIHLQGFIVHGDM